ncbi:MAG: NAD(+) diphosphatase [Pseudomonadota bacterium]
MLDMIPAPTIDRAAHLRSDKDWMAKAQLSPTARYFITIDEAPAIVANDERTKASIRWFTYADIEKFDFIREIPIFLGLDENEHPVFALNITEHRSRIMPGGPFTLKPWVDLRSLAVQGVMSLEELSLVGMAKAVTAWQQTARCCGFCGGTTNIRDGGWRRKCWSCERQFFPRMDPAVIMLVTDGDRCILAHEERFPDKMYSTLAGFVEPGESFEEAVRREVHEEVGITVGDVSYIASQPWPFPHSLMIGCLGVAQTTDITPDPKEIADAQWFTRDDIAAILDNQHADDITAPMPWSIAHKLMRHFVDMPAH